MKCQMNYMSLIIFPTITEQSNMPLIRITGYYNSKV